VPRRIALAAGVSAKAVRILELEPDGPAARGGLRVGDTIVALDDHGIGGADDLMRLLGADRVGKVIRLTLLREDRVEQATVIASERRLRRSAPTDQ
jgi:S1-C subfamily serine protease